MQTDNPLIAIVERLLKDGHGRLLSQRSMRAGHIVYSGDEAADGDLLIVRSGRLRCFTSFEGKELTLYMLEAGDAIYLNSGTMLEVRTAADIVLASPAAFRQLALAETELALAVLPALDRLAQKSVRMIEDIAFHGVKHRLIRALCDTADRIGRTADEGIVIDQLPNAEDFAMQIGATRQSVSTVIAELVRSGILYRFGGGSMVISDLGRLRRELADVR
ncbi:Crp/Fnr family transcriptional regulator [Pleomorphomonas sp. PLEO]|uniref:Crp/Fnr family transcriptional regulator n=1 Tax=Pleomorphomonas sp. PLEO TaxID=3239306 RepID=UPI00351DC1FC